jgi:hypothetical protein
MKIKTLQSNSLEDLEFMANKFDAENKVKFTQSHVTYMQGSGALVYTLIVFYEDK